MLAVPAFFIGLTRGASRRSGRQLAARPALPGRGTGYAAPVRGAGSSVHFSFEPPDDVAKIFLGLAAGLVEVMLRKAGRGQGGHGGSGGNRQPPAVTTHTTGRTRPACRCGRNRHKFLFHRPRPFRPAPQSARGSFLHQRTRRPPARKDADCFRRRRTLRYVPGNDSRT